MAATEVELELLLFFFTHFAEKLETLPLLGLALFCARARLFSPCPFNFEEFPGQ